MTYRRITIIQRRTLAVPLPQTIIKVVTPFEKRFTDLTSGTSYIGNPIDDYNPYTDTRNDHNYIRAKQFRDYQAYLKKLELMKVPISAGKLKASLLGLVDILKVDPRKEKKRKPKEIPIFPARKSKMGGRG